MIDLRGSYVLSVGEGKKHVNVPMMISDTPADLYGACSPRHPWHSSLTFTHGVPLEHDAHGAEKTLYGYIRLGTMVAFIPQSPGKSTPPWHAREFIHTCFDPSKLVPQPPYAKERVYAWLLSDAVTDVLYRNRFNEGWGMCDLKYENVYIDVGITEPITSDDIDIINRRWDTRKLTTRL